MYQYVLRFIDEQFVEKGVIWFFECGEGDVSGDFEGQFDEWKKSMWIDVIKVFGFEFNENVDKE